MNCENGFETMIMHCLVKHGKIQVFEKELLEENVD